MINQNPIDDAAGYYEYSINHCHANPTKSSKEAVKDKSFLGKGKIILLKYLYRRLNTSFPKAKKLTIQLKSMATFKNSKTICKQVQFY